MQHGNSALAILRQQNSCLNQFSNSTLLHYIYIVWNSLLFPDHSKHPIKKVKKMKRTQQVERERKTPCQILDKFIVPIHHSHRPKNERTTFIESQSVERRSNGRWERTIRILFCVLKQKKKERKNEHENVISYRRLPEEWRTSAESRI